jgi:hypothetical protein
MIKRPVVLLSAILALGLGFNYGAWAQSATPAAEALEHVLRLLLHVRPLVE